jgi:predicted transposase YdaD
MKTDKLFYRIFLSQPDLIAELMPGIPAGCEFDYSAPVVKEREVRLDGLLGYSSPTTLSGRFTAIDGIKPKSGDPAAVDFARSRG